MAILRLSARVMVMVCLPPGVNGANHRCMSSLINEKKIVVFKVMLNGTIRNEIYSATQRCNVGTML